MNISPKTAMWLNGAVAVLGVLAAGALPKYVPAGPAAYISQTAAWVLAVYGSVNAALHGVSAPVAGPVAAPLARMAARFRR